MMASTVTELISQFGLIIFAFFFMSMAVETLLESFRGFLSAIGIRALQSKGTLDEALTSAADLVSAESKALAKFTALAALVKEKSTASSALVEKLNDLEVKLKEPGDPATREAMVLSETGWLAQAAEPIKRAMQADESSRVLLLRLISAIIGAALATLVGLKFSDVLSGPAALKAQGMAAWVSYVGFGLASAGGSSYWHDWLDRVRKLKDASAQLALLKV